MESRQEGGGAHCFVLYFCALELTFNLRRCTSNPVAVVKVGGELYQWLPSN